MIRPLTSDTAFELPVLLQSKNNNKPSLLLAISPSIFYKYPIFRSTCKGRVLRYIFDFPVLNFEIDLQRLALRPIQAQAI